VLVEGNIERLGGGCSGWLSFDSLKNEFLILGQDVDLFGICRGI